MFGWSADANTSAGAPCVSWVTRVEDPAKLKVTFVPAWACSNALPSSANAVESDCAAYTLTVPLTSAAFGGGASWSQAPRSRIASGSSRVASGLRIRRTIVSDCLLTLVEFVEAVEERQRRPARLLPPERHRIVGVVGPRPPGRNPRSLGGDEPPPVDAEEPRQLELH